MARNIFEITSEIAVAKTDLFASEEEIEKRLEILMNELIHKEDAVLALYESFQQDIDLADKYIDKIKKQKTIRQNSQKSMKNMIIDCYQLTEKLPKHSEFNPIKIMESMSVDIINEKNIPEEYWKEKTVRVLDKRKMLEHLKKGKVIAGADLKHAKYVKGLK